MARNDYAEIFGREEVKMAAPYDILCPTCGTVCGKRYPSTWDEPGFCEGVGENFVLGMVWHCSQSCLDQAKREGSLESVRSIAERTGIADEVRKLEESDDE